MCSPCSTTSGPSTRKRSRVGLALTLIAAFGIAASGEPAAAEPDAPNTPRMLFSARNELARLAELYTSEGCSSCPPADRWLGRFFGHPELFRSIVPVASHVDYWDDLGWPERFADPAYGERQRRLTESGRAESVYTPGVFVNGFDGRRPQHDFVVLAHGRRVAHARGSALIPLTAHTLPGGARFAFAVWVTDHSGDYLQATGGWLSRAEAVALVGLRMD